MLHRSCRLARKWSGGTLPNPAADADLPAWGLGERPAEVRAAEPDEVIRLLAAAENDDPRFACFLRVLAATGMRRGEACALRWSDLDLNLAVVTVDESVISAKGGALVKAPRPGPASAGWPLIPSPSRPLSLCGRSRIAWQLGAGRRCELRASCSPPRPAAACRPTPMP